MAQQHKQAFCHRCGELTLHVGDSYSVPHVVHALLTLLTCFVWLLVWLLHIFVNCFEQPTFLCSRCGQAEVKPDRPAPRPQSAAEIAWTAERRHARIARRRRWQAEAALRIEWCILYVWHLPRTVDALLRRTAGEGNDLVYRFLQCLAVIAALAILALGIWLSLP